ncbi:MAG: homocysteine biosynthesis protein [Promethearchaeota archaeon]
MPKTYEEINEKIRDGSVTVLTAEEMKEFVAEHGAEVAAREVDVVTTGTFGAMCSSGAFFNFGHSEPPIKMEHVWMNGVHCYHGNAAVDVYLGASRMSEITPFKYGGGHVIEDLLKGKAIEVTATAYPTDTYPKTELQTEITLEDLNQAILCNPRNGYQTYSCATNSTNRTIYTYMGKLLPNFGNATYSGAGALAPLANDPDYETIGIGTRIFLGGGVGYVVGEGTQHNPKKQLGTLFLKGDLKQMSPDFLKGASFMHYGTSMYVGFGIPIPILNEGLARKTAVTDDKIVTAVYDYGVASRDKPKLRDVTYAELKGGRVEIGGREVRVSSMSSLRKAKQIAKILRDWIARGEFFLSRPAETLPTDTVFKPMKVTSETRFVGGFMRKPVVCNEEATLCEVAKLIVQTGENHVIVTNDRDELVGIVTSFDISRAVAEDKKDLKSIITRRVVTTTPDEPLEAAAQKMKRREINGLPVLKDGKKVIGLITSSDIVKKTLSNERKEGRNERK